MESPFMSGFVDELTKVGVSLAWVRSMAGRGALKRSPKSLAASERRLNISKMDLGAKRKDLERARGGLGGYTHLPREDVFKAEQKMTGEIERLMSQEVKARAAAAEVRRIRGARVPSGVAA